LEFHQSGDRVSTGSSFETIWRWVRVKGLAPRRTRRRPGSSLWKECLRSPVVGSGLPGMPSLLSPCVFVRPRGDRVKTRDCAPLRPITENGAIWRAYFGARVAGVEHDKAHFRRPIAAHDRGNRHSPLTRPAKNSPSRCIRGILADQWAGIVMTRPDRDRIRARSQYPRHPWSFSQANQPRTHWPFHGLPCWRLSSLNIRQTKRRDIQSSAASGFASGPPCESHAVARRR
jgi:hypothetical protein